MKYMIPMYDEWFKGFTKIDKKLIFRIKLEKFGTSYLVFCSLVSSKDSLPQSLSIPQKEVLLEWFIPSTILDLSNIDCCDLSKLIWKPPMFRDWDLCPDSELPSNYHKLRSLCLNPQTKGIDPWRIKRNVLMSRKSSWNI